MLLGSTQGALAALYETLQASALLLFTDPTQLSPGQAVLVGGSVLFVGTVLRTVWGTDGQRRNKVKSRSEFTPVYYHTWPPVKAIPCLSPFGMKLETYLRMADIPYETVYGLSMGPKGKVPWIEYNGEAMGDSGLIIEFLNREKGVDLDQILSDTDKAVSRAFTKMLEENTFWGGVRNRWINNIDKLQEVVAPWTAPRIIMFLLTRSARSNVRRKLWTHGVGRYSRDEIEGILEKDIKALSHFLGTKPYLMGDEPTEVDAAAFGQLSVACCAFPGIYLERLVTVDCPNLQAYFNRNRTAIGQTGTS
ncbi:failed axon connections homolog [Branchiostoma lanceolatum]|uniref:failed axon connections homolog n=1 Tax=Branchiostoma lanceolatum TaxID=7740 RepID=UPI0034556AC2